MKRKLIKRNKQRLTRDIKEIRKLAYMFFGAKGDEIKVITSQKLKTVEFPNKASVVE